MSKPRNRSATARLRSGPIPRTRRTDRLGRDAWIEAGRRALIAGGVGTVKVEPLAAALGVTTGSFYWHFGDRDELLTALLDDWELRNSDAMFAAASRHDGDAAAALRAVFNVWIEEADYSPAWDSAIRDWARTDERAAQRVRRVDDRRIRLLASLFAKRGERGPRAFIRARVTYFHQVGYYAMRITESHARRRRLLPLYIDVLLGSQ